MSLRMGIVGRGFLHYVLSGRQGVHDIRLLSRLAHRVLGKRYTPGLTTDTFHLAQRVVDGQAVEIRSNGLFANGRKLAKNPLGEYFPNPVTMRFGRYTPENLAAFARFVVKQSNNIFFISSDEAPTFQEIGYNAHILPRLIERASNLKELTKWNKEVLKLLNEYNDRYHTPAEYIAIGLPGFLEKIQTLKTLRKARRLICSDSDSDRNQMAYFHFVQVTVPQLLGINISPSASASSRPS